MRESMHQAGSFALEQLINADGGGHAVGALLLGAIAAVASFIPAWRASKVDPLKDLRWE